MKMYRINHLLSEDFKRQKRFKGFLNIILLLVFSLILSTCNVSDKRGVYSGSIKLDTVPEYLSDTCFAGSLDFFALPSVEAFYKKRNYRTAWSAGKKLTNRADSLLYIIQNSRFYGLSPQDYHLPELKKLLDLMDFHDVDSLTQLQYVAQIDKLLTNSFFTMAHHLKNGRIDNIKNTKLGKPEAADTSLVLLLENALMNNTLGKNLASLEPQHYQYIALKAALKKRFDIQFNEGEKDSDSIDVDKVLKEIKIISLNLERWRSERKELLQNQIFINLPAFRLDVKEENKVVLTSKVIIGKPATPTPLLDGMLECFIVYPYWTVPRSIATQEILPKVQKDINYLQLHNYQVLDTKGSILDPFSLDWPAFTSRNFPYTFRQTEGDYNALGVVKFMFDNPYSVYLHDTNSRSLFQRENRALSHGCIRVEKYFELASYLTRDNPSFQEPQVLRKLFETKKRKTVNLLEPVPLFIRYFTAEVIDDSVVFYNDMYKKDEKLERLIMENISI